MIAIEKIRAEFNQLAKRKPATLYDGSSLSVAGSGWLIEAMALVEATFAEAHATARTMRAAFDYLRSHAPYGENLYTFYGQANTAEGGFNAAKQIVDGDGIRGLVDIVRADTEADLLDQSEVFLKENAIAAAAVIAGGALETHLRGVVEGVGIPWNGDRGIATYNNAIASHRKKNPSLPLYSAATGDSISGWAKMRNDAAHDPIAFTKNYRVETVKQMIDGIRLVISSAH